MENLDSVDQVGTGPIPVTIPLHDFHSPVNVNGPGLSIQSQPTPVPEFKSEDIGCGTDLQNHTTLPGTVNGPGRDKEMIVFFCRPGLDIFLRIKFTCLLGLPQLRLHRYRVSVCFKSKVYPCIFIGIEHVITLILRVVHAEVLLDVFGERVDLEGEVAAVDGIEEIEAEDTPEEAQTTIKSSLRKKLDKDDELKQQLEALLKQAAEKGAAGSTVTISNSKNVVQGSNIQVGGDFRLGDDISQ